MDTPSPEEVRQALAHLDARRQKIVAGLFAVMIKDPARVRDREWIAENFTRLAVAAHGFDESGEVDEEVQTIQRFVQLSMNQVLDVAFPLFAQVAAELSAEKGPGKFSLDDACQRALSYFG